VAIDLFANEAERLARFTREAQTLASLNHPNIAHIHGLEESGGVRALLRKSVSPPEHARAPGNRAQICAVVSANLLRDAHGVTIKSFSERQLKVTDRFPHADTYAVMQSALIPTAL
jgi:hypothetical protein